MFVFKLGKVTVQDSYKKDVKSTWRLFRQVSLKLDNKFMQSMRAIRQLLNIYSGWQNACIPFKLKSFDFCRLTHQDNFDLNKTPHSYS